MTTAPGRPPVPSDTLRPSRRTVRDRVPAAAAAVAVAAVVEVLLREDVLWPVAAVVMGGVLAAAVLVRRRHPLLAVLLGFGGFAVLDVASWLLADRGFTLWTGVSVLVLAYALTRWGSPRQVGLGAVVVVGEWAVATATSWSGVTDAVGGLTVLLLAGALGAVVRSRSQVRAQQLLQVRSSEREALSRELHDTVAHHVSAIAVQAQAGRFLAGRGDLAGAADALAVVEKEASRALTEMRAMVGTLRGDGATTERTRGLADVDDLADPDAAPRVVVTRAGDLDSLGPSVQATLYRVAQESVTNARRHARGGTRVEVVLTCDEHHVRLGVDDDGERTSGDQAPGYGLVGMAERVSLLGGTFDAGRRSDGGWSVQAVIPRRDGS